MNIPFSNTMLTEAEPLLQYVVQQKQPEYQAICQSMTAFNTQCKNAGYAQPNIDDACFFLSALLDDRFTWKKPLVATFFSNNPVDFYDRLTQQQKDPHTHIDLLELAYVCFSLGLGNGQETITTMDVLYRDIRDVRGDPPHDLSDIQAVEKTTSRYFPPVWTTILLAVIILIVIFIPYHRKLNQATLPALQTLENMVKTDKSRTSQQATRHGLQTTRLDPLTQPLPQSE